MCAYELETTVCGLVLCVLLFLAARALNSSERQNIGWVEYVTQQSRIHWIKVNILKHQKIGGNNQVIEKKHVRRCDRTGIGHQRDCIS